MTAFAMNIKGMEGVKKMLDKANKAVNDTLDMEMTAFAIDVNRKQIQYTPVDTGRLKDGNNIKVETKLKKTIFNKITYGPYVEFGTGGLVRVPEGLEAYAMQFKGKGVKQINMNAQPFFFRAYFEELPKFVEKLKKLVENTK